MVHAAGCARGCHRSPLVDEILREHRPRAIVHFAAETHVDGSIGGPDHFSRTNMNRTFSLLEEVRTYSVESPELQTRTFRFLHLSTPTRCTVRSGRMIRLSTRTRATNRTVLVQHPRLPRALLGQALDLRKSSDAVGQWCAVRVSDDNKLMMVARWLRGWFPSHLRNCARPV